MLEAWQNEPTAEHRRRDDGEDGAHVVRNLRPGFLQPHGFFLVHGDLEQGHVER